jgi:hypothetical protein
MAVIASPAYVKRHGFPKTPRDLRSHRCSNLRLPTAGTIYEWEFERGAEKMEIAVEGPLIFDAGGMVTGAALAGLGLGYVLQDRVLDHLESGALMRVLADWCPPFPGFHLYYPGRRQLSPALAAFIDAIRVPSRPKSGSSYRTAACEACRMTAYADLQQPESGTKDCVRGYERSRTRAGSGRRFITARAAPKSTSAATAVVSHSRVEAAGSNSPAIAPAANKRRRPVSAAALNNAFITPLPKLDHTAVRHSTRSMAWRLAQDQADFESAAAMRSEVTLCNDAAPCSLRQRPAPALAAGLGVWAPRCKALARMTLLRNAALRLEPLCGGRLSA